MSFVIAAPELVQGAAQDLAGIGSSLADAAATASGPTTGIAAAAQDEVSIAIASLFGKFGQEFQALGAQAQAFHTQFVGLLNAGAGAYVSAEAANAEQALLGGVGAGAAAPLLPGLSGFGATVAAPYQALVSTTLTNAQTVFGASQQALSTLFGGVSAEFGLLTTNPGAALNNLVTAAQSVALIGAPTDVQSAVVNHTLGGVTTITAGPDDGTLVPDIHLHVYQGLVGTGDFTPPSGPEGALVSALANFSASPLSGVLIGALGPVVSPAVALFNEGHAIFADLTGATPHPVADLAALLDTPATVTNAFFNGATLNLDPLAPIFNPFVSAGDDGGEQLNGLSVAFGGLFSPGQVITGVNGPMYYGTGGSLFNSLGLDLSLIPPDEGAGDIIAVPGIPVGPIGATAGLIDIFGQALGGSLLS